jgi:hypothetical protein
MVGGHTNAWPIQDLGGRHLSRRVHKYPVERQKRTANGKGRRRRSGKRRAKHLWRQSKPAPGPPLIEITDQRGRSRAPPKEVLADRAHLRDPQTLPERKMRPDEPKRLPFARRIDDHRAAMAMPRQIKQGDVVDLERRMEKDDDAQKSMTAFAPSVIGRAMDMAKPSHVFDLMQVEESMMGRHFLIGFLEDQSIATRTPNLIAQHRHGARRINDIVIAAAAVNVPTDAMQQRLNPIREGHDSMSSLALNIGGADDCPST